MGAGGRCQPDLDAGDRGRHRGAARPALDRESAGQPLTQRPAQATQFVEADGVRLAYDVTGDGPPVVLLHAGIVDRGMWDDVVPLLADAFRVIRYDARGFGESSRPPDGEFARWDDLVAVMDAVGVERAHLVGVSQGAETALDAALAAPDRVDQLVLVGAGMRGWPFRDELNARWQAEVDAWERGDLDGCAEVSMGTWFDGPMRTSAQVDPVIRSRAWQMQRRAIDLENDDAQARSLEPPAAERLGEVRAATLVAVGELDQPDMVAIAEKLAAQVPGARHEVLPGVAHLPPMEKPAEFAALVRDFLGQ